MAEPSSRQVTEITDFSGGQSRLSPEKIGVNQARVLRNVIPGEVARTYPGNLKMNSVEIDTDHGIQSLTRFYVNAEKYTVCQADEWIWVDTGNWTFKRLYPIAYGEGTPMRFQTWGGGLWWAEMQQITPIMSAPDYNELHRWDGTYYCTGKLTFAGTPAVPPYTYVGTASEGADFTDLLALDRLGFLLFWKEPTTGNWVESPVCVVDIPDASHVRIRAPFTSVPNRPTTGTAVEYMIVSAYPWWLAPPAKPALTAAGSGGSMNAGDHVFGISYKCSWTGYETAVVWSDPVTCVANDKVTISGIVDFPYENGGPEIPYWAFWQWDSIEVYMSPADGDETTCFHIATISRDQTFYTFPTTKVISNADDDLELDAPAPIDNVTPILDSGISDLLATRDRLILSDFSGNRWLSQINYPYFPPTDLDSTDPFGEDSDAGVVVPCGEVSARSGGMCVEGPQYGTAGLPGGTRLMLTNEGAYRIYGRLYEELDVQPASAEKSLCPFAVVADLAMTWFMTAKGPCMLPVGSPVPVPIWAVNFPKDDYPFSDFCNPDYLHLAQAAFWDPWVIITWPGPNSTYNNRCMAFNRDAPYAAWEIGTPDTQEMTAGCFCVFDGPGDDGSIYFGDSQSGYIWQMFAKTESTIDGETVYQSLWDGENGVLWEWQTGWWPVKSATGHPKTLGQLFPTYVEYRMPTTEQVVTVTPVLDGVEADEGYEDTIPVGEGLGWREYPTGDMAYWLGLMFSGEATEQLVIERLVLECIRLGRDRKAGG